MRKLTPKINPYVVYPAILLVLAALFFGVHSWTSLKEAERASGHAGQGEEHANVLGEKSYKVLEEQQARGDRLPAYEFPKLNVVSGKIPKGWQLSVKDAHVTERTVTPDGTKAICIVKRVHTEEANEWTELDTVVANPGAQTSTHEALAFVYGPWGQIAGEATKIAGFVSNDEFVFTSVRNAGEDLSYYVGQYNTINNTVTPLLEIGKTKKGDNGPLAVQKVWLSTDKKKLYLLGGQNEVAEYDLKTGKKSVPLPAGGGKKNVLWLSEQAGIAYVSTDEFAPDGSLLQLNSGEVKKPFAMESGWIDTGLAAKGKMVYYNFTTDRSAQHILQGDKRKLLLSQGVQLTEASGTKLKRFVLPQGSKERLEYAGFAEEKHAVILHKYTTAVNGKGQTFKKTAGWMLGDMNTGKLTELVQADVPDGWEAKDVAMGEAIVDAYAESGAVQVFVNLADGTCYMTKWRTRNALALRDQDTILFADDMSKRVFISSLTRPDLVVAAFSYKKYKWDNGLFAWLEGRWLFRYYSQPDGDNIYFFQIL